MSIIETVTHNVEIIKNCYPLLLESDDAASIQRSIDLAENTHKLLSLCVEADEMVLKNLNDENMNILLIRKELESNTDEALKKIIECCQQVEYTYNNILALQNQHNQHMKHVSNQEEIVEGFRKKVEADESNAKTGAAVRGVVAGAALGSTFALASGPVGWLALGVGAIATVISEKKNIENARRIIEASKCQYYESQECLRKEQGKGRDLRESLYDSQCSYDEQLLHSEFFNLQLDDCEFMENKIVEEGILTAENLTNMRMEVVLLKRQEQLWGHFKDELYKVFQFQDHYTQTLKVFSNNLKPIIGHLVEETPMQFLTKDLPSKFELVQEEMFELDGICECLTSEQNNTPMLADLYT